MHVQKSQHTTELLLYASRTCVDTNAHTHTHHKYRRAISHGIRLDFDTALLTSLPSALQKDPASRGTFDNVVVTNVEDELQKRPLNRGKPIGKPEENHRKMMVFMGFYGMLWILMEF